MSLSLWVNSMAVGLGATGLAIGAGLVVALATVTSGRRARQVWLTLTLANFALPPFLIANVWLDLTATWRALASPEVMALGSLPLTALVLASLLWPLTCWVTVGAWSKLQPEHFEADPQGRGWRLLRGLLLPATGRELTVVAAITFVLALANFTVPTLFQVRVFTEEFWIRFNTQFDTAGALRATWPLVVFPLLLLFLARRRPVAWPRLQLPVPAAQLRSQLGGWAGATQALGLGWLLLVLGLPIGRWMTTARTWTELPGALAAGHRALVNTILTSVIPATVVLLLALIVTLGRTKPRSPQASWLWFLVPGVFLGVGLIAVFNHPSLQVFYQSLGLVFLALTLRYTAPGWALAAGALRATDPSLADAASSLGAGRWRIIRDALLPQAAPGLAAAWYAVYLLCLWDVETVVLIQPPGGETLALRIFNLLHYGHAAQVNALCVVMLGLALAPWAAGALLRRLWPVGKLHSA